MNVSSKDAAIIYSLLRNNFGDTINNIEQKRRPLPWQQHSGNVNQLEFHLLLFIILASSTLSFQPPLWLLLSCHKWHSTSSKRRTRSLTQACSSGSGGSRGAWTWAVMGPATFGCINILQSCLDKCDFCHSQEYSILELRPQQFTNQQLVVSMPVLYQMMNQLDLLVD